MVRPSRDFGKREKRRCGALLGAYRAIGRHCERQRSNPFFLCSVAWIASLRSQ
jgi:hypothetical protein